MYKFESPKPPSLNDLSHTQQEVLRGLVAGHSISAAARRAGVHRATVHLWIRTVPTFGRALDTHRRLRADRIADDLNDLTDSALSALRQILDDTEAPAAVRHKTAIDILNLAHRHEEGRIYPDSHLLAGFHAELDAAVAPTPSAPSTAPSAKSMEAPIEKTMEKPEEEEIASPGETVHPTHPSPVRNAPCPCGSRLKYKRCCGKVPLQTLAA